MYDDGCRVDFQVVSFSANPFLPQVCIGFASQRTNTTDIPQTQQWIMLTMLSFSQSSFVFYKAIALLSSIVFHWVKTSNKLQ